MAFPFWPSTGPVAEWLSWHGVASSEILGWWALYWDGSGNVDQVGVFASVNTPQATLVSDPETLPPQHMQAYLVPYSRVSRRKLHIIWQDGFDEYYLIGRAEPVTGTLLTAKKWQQMQAKIRSVYDEILEVCA